MIEVGVAHAGKGGYDAPPEHKASSIVVDFITPETDTSIWYFWGMARNFNVGDAALTDTIRTGQAAIFAEDLAILEAQQRNLNEQPERHLMRLNIDMGGFEAPVWATLRHALAAFNARTDAEVTQTIREVAPELLPGAGVGTVNARPSPFGKAPGQGKSSVTEPDPKEE